MGGEGVYMLPSIVRVADGDFLWFGYFGLKKYGYLSKLEQFLLGVAISGITNNTRFLRSGEFAMNFAWAPHFVSIFSF